MQKPKAPCKDCPRHQLGCRTDCPEWQQYEKDRAEWGEVVKAIMDDMRNIRDYKYRGIYKRIKLDNSAKRK